MVADRSMTRVRCFAAMGYMFFPSADSISRVGPLRGRCHREAVCSEQQQSNSHRSARNWAESGTSWMSYGPEAFNGRHTDRRSFGRSGQRNPKWRSVVIAGRRIHLALAAAAVVVVCTLQAPPCQAQSVVRDSSDLHGVEPVASRVQDSLERMLESAAAASYVHDVSIK